MSIKQQREEFIARFVCELVDGINHNPISALGVARKFLRLSQTHGNLATAYCNGDYPCHGPWNRTGRHGCKPSRHQEAICTECEANVIATTCNKAGVCKKCRIEAQLKELAASTNGIFTLKLQQDPRGWTVRVVTSNGIEIGVPQHG